VTNIFEGIKSLALLERSLDLRALKHLQIVSNIANTTNAGYEAFEVVLDGALKGLDGDDGSSASLSVTHEKHLSPGGPDLQGVEYKPQVTKMEEEMARLTENHLMYNASVELLNRQLRMLRLAIMDRA
jgi:flagellar basal-body rod protein FlgB